MENIMGASDRRNKSQAMAADLVRRGYPHGKRMSVTNANPMPSLNASGSAAYRRALAGKTVTTKAGPRPYSPSLNESITLALANGIDHVGRNEAKVHVTERELQRR